MKNLNRKLLVIGFLVFVAGAFMPAHSFADVNVYAEGAYDDTYLDVYIYADLSVTNVISYGVSLNYLPTQLAVVSATKNLSPDPPPYTSNTTLWEIGTGLNKDNPDPDTTTSGAVIFKGGILNESTPTAGVVDLTRVFLGMVSFEAGSGGVLPAAPTLSLTYAEGDGTGDYKNFVRYDDTATPPDPPGEVLDSADSSGVDFTTIGITISQRGDVNADGVMNVNDIRQLKRDIGSPDLPPWKDCNGDGVVNVNDIRWLKRNI